MVDDVTRKRKRLSKKRKKWHRRIAIAKACQKLHLTHVRSGKGELWFSAEDIIDHIAENKGGKRKDMTMNEFTNRVRHLLTQDFVTTTFVDTTVSRPIKGGAVKKRWRRQLFRIDDITLLAPYIASCQAAAQRID
tara:strand:- start:7862 stop:8266 length:405 start_codon:yes stop_codon:yes gene_type:complete